MVKIMLMEYMYRDANNYKANGSIYLIGEFNLEYEKIIRGCLEASEIFVAEQVNIPTLYSQLWKYSNGITTADHAYHEFIGLKPFYEAVAQDVIIWGSIEKLIALFTSSKDKWDCTESIHCNF